MPSTYAADVQNVDLPGCDAVILLNDYMLQLHFRCLPWQLVFLFRWDLVLLVSLSSADVEELWSRSRDVLDVDVNRYPAKYSALQSRRTAFFALRPSPAPQRRHLRADDRAGHAWCGCLSPSVLPSGTGTCGFRPFPGHLAAP